MFTFRILSVWVVGFFFLVFTGRALYELLKDYLLTEEQLNENNFPRPNPEKNGSAILTGIVKNAGYDGKCLLDCNKLGFQSVVHRAVKYTGIRLYVMAAFHI